MQAICSHVCVCYLCSDVLSLLCATATELPVARDSLTFAIIIDVLQAIASDAHAQAAAVAAAPAAATGTMAVTVAPPTEPLLPPPPLATAAAISAAPLVVSPTVAAVDDDEVGRVLAAHAREQRAAAEVLERERDRQAAATAQVRVSKC